jgi:amino acid adenylation domain-containing protein
MARSVYVPLNPRFPHDRILAMLITSAADVVIIDSRSSAVARHLLTGCDRSLIVLLPDFATPPDWAAHLPRHHFFCRSDIERLTPPVAYPAANPHDGAYLLFTSGSTGLPKGVLISHANALTYVANVRERYQPASSDRFSQLFDFSFDLSVHDMFLCWSAGACLYCVPNSAKSGPRDFIRRHELSFWFSVPSTAAFMSRMRMLRPGDFPSLRWSLFCGEALPMRVAREWQQAAPSSTVENLYGPTEATIAFTAYRVPDDSEDDEPDIVPIGWPLPGQEISVIAPNGRPVPNGEPGELYLSGSQVAGGYWRLPEKTTERFAPPQGVRNGMGWYRTGDLVLNSSKHGLRFLGRIDRQVKIRGYRVELQEIETVMRSTAGTDTVAVIPWPVMRNGLALGVVGFVSGRQATIREILDECHKQLPEYMVPSDINDLAEWPLNSNGKTDYNALRLIVEKLRCR